MAVWIVCENFKLVYCCSCWTLLYPDVAYSTPRYQRFVKIQKKSSLFVGQIFLTLNFCLGLYRSSLGSAMVSTDWTTSLASGGSGHQRHDVFVVFWQKLLSHPRKWKTCLLHLHCVSCLVLLHRCVTLSLHFPGLKNSMQTVNKSKKGITSHHLTHTTIDTAVVLPFVQILRGPQQ